VVALPKYNLKGERIGDLKISDQALQLQVNSQMVKDYVVALRHNWRQWSASTKGRSEVEHTTKKPFAQKGQGRARQGTLVAPQHRGGGVYGGPKPKFDQRVRINKQERQQAVRYLIAEKIREGKLSVLADTVMEQPKTGQVAKLLRQAGLNRRVLILAEAPQDRHGHLALSVRNLPEAEFGLAVNVNGYALMVAHHLLVTEAALREWEWLFGEAK
jgi:large subunit ribosomal protein L4